MPEFKPYVPHDSTEPEFTFKAALAGILMAALFGAANAYLGMKAGQTVAATIPAAVIAIQFLSPKTRFAFAESNYAQRARTTEGGSAALLRKLRLGPRPARRSFDGGPVGSHLRGDHILW